MNHDEQQRPGRRGGGVMADAQRTYWQEMVAESLEEHGVAATDDQVASIAADVQGSHDSYDLAFPGPPPGPSYDKQEADRLKRELADERDKVICRECGGEGRIRTGPLHYSDSDCWKCRGEGRHKP